MVPAAVSKGRPVARSPQPLRFRGQDTREKYLARQVPFWYILDLAVPDSIKKASPRAICMLNAVCQTRQKSRKIGQKKADNKPPNETATIR